MQVVIRTYRGKGTKELFDLMAAYEAEVQPMMRAIEGLVSYTLARAGDGGFSVTVCRDNRGIKKSVKTARDFIAKHPPDRNVAAMHISAGSVITHIHT